MSLQPNPGPFKCTFCKEWLHTLLAWDLERNSGSRMNPEGPCTQYLGTWDMGNSNYSIGFG